MVLLQNDSGILLVANRIGAALGKSVYQDAKLLEGEFVQYYDEMLKLWGDTHKGVTAPFDFGFKCYRCCSKRTEMVKKQSNWQ